MLHPDDMRSPQARINLKTTRRDRLTSALRRAAPWLLAAMIIAAIWLAVTTAFATARDLTDVLAQAETLRGM